MKKCMFLASLSKRGFLILIVFYSTVPLQAQTKSPSSVTAGTAGVVLVDTDDSCRLVLDGDDQGVVKPDEPKKITVKLGDHILKCTVEGIPDLVWRKVIEVRNSEQVAVLISLKALHIQYEDATAKLEKNKSAASTGSVSAPQQATAHESSPSKERVGAEDQFRAMKVHYDSGLAAIQQMKAAQAQLAQSPRGQQNLIKDKINQAGSTAVTELSTALALMKPDDPNRSIVLSRLGEAYVNMDKGQEAIEPLQKATTLDPKNATAWLLLGRALVNAMEFKIVGDKVSPVMKPGTVEAYQHAIDLDPNGPIGADAKKALGGLQEMGFSIASPGVGHH